MSKKIFINQVRWILFILLIGIHSISIADPAPVNQMNESVFRDSLVGIINQLQSIKPLIAQAEQTQPSHARVLLHFQPWQDVNGQWHSGLQSDLNSIQQALINALNVADVEPRTVAPLKTDFIQEAP